MVYAKRSFGGSEQVFEYLGRYTHCTGISNQRIQSMGPDGVCFATKGGRSITLRADEFIRRFLLHVLPPGFVKMRHFGLWAGGAAKHKLAVAQKLLCDEAAVAASSQAPAAALAPEPAPDNTIDDDTDEMDEVDADETDDLAERILRLCGIDVKQCPSCEHGRMKRQPLPLPASNAVESVMDTS